MDEMLDVLDETGGKTGRTAPKSEVHRRGLLHRCFHCWVVDPEGPHLFVQRRAAGKETWPGRLDVTAAGHLQAGEEVFDGLRELEEELGLVARPEDLVSLGTRRIEREIPGIGLDREFQEVFVLARPLAPDDLSLQREEVAAILRLRLQDVDLLGEGKDIPAQAWSQGGVQETSAAPSDFVPGEDGYLQRVATAALDMLDGHDPGIVIRES